MKGTSWIKNPSYEAFIANMITNLIKSNLKNPVFQQPEIKAGISATDAALYDSIDAILEYIKFNVREILL